jgi:hypothetical protein
VRPALLRRPLMAGTGPYPMIVGSTPASGEVDDGGRENRRRGAYSRHINSTENAFLPEM